MPRSTRAATGWITPGSSLRQSWTRGPRGIRRRSRSTKPERGAPRKLTRSWTRTATGTDCNSPGGFAPFPNVALLLGSELEDEGAARAADDDHVAIAQLHRSSTMLPPQHRAFDDGATGALAIDQHEARPVVL